MNPVIFVVGSTASGKSQLALSLAQQFGGAILNCDSVQVYKRLDIGTAKPSVEERSLVPHLLFDFVKPGDVLTAGDFRKVALEALNRTLPVQPVFAVGGSGFYIQALEKGMFEIEKPKPESEARVRTRLEKEGSEALYQELQERDPEYAKQVSSNDVYRVTRALIVMEESGQKMSEVRANFKGESLPFPFIKMGLSMEREVLLERVRSRTHEMLKKGWVAEVKALLEEGHEAWPPLKSVGYKECVEHLEGLISESALPDKITEKTMQLAKKQRTWFKRDSQIQWLKTIAEAGVVVSEFLNLKGIA